MSEARGGPVLSGWKLSLLAAIGGLLVGALAVSLWFNLRGGAGQAQTEAIVRAYILENGEILPEAIERMQRRQARAAVLQNREALERPYRGAWAGAENGDVVMVQFFDYACPYCQQINGDVERLLREDGRLKVVWREYPVLGPSSEEAAIASLAAARLGRFRPFHDNLFAAGPPTEASIAAARAAVGVQSATLTDEFRTELERNFDLGRAIGASGTPTFIIGDQVFQGAVGYETLKEAIEEARAG